MVCPNERPHLPYRWAQIWVFPKKQSGIDWLIAPTFSDIYFMLLHSKSDRPPKQLLQLEPSIFERMVKQITTPLCSINAYLQNIVNISSSMSQNFLTPMPFSTIWDLHRWNETSPSQSFSKSVVVLPKLTPWWGLTQRSKTIECVLDHSGGVLRDVDSGYSFFFEDHRTLGVALVWTRLVSDLYNTCWYIQKIWDHVHHLIFGSQNRHLAKPTWQ